MTTLNLKASDIVLSVGSTHAESSSPAGGGSALSSSSKNAGKFYFEVRPTQLYSANPGFLTGLMRGTGDLSTYTGASANSWAIASTASGSSTWHDGTQANSVSGGQSDVAHYHRVAVDLDAGKIWLGASNRNGGAWSGGGNPESGTLPTFSYEPSAVPVHIALCPRRGHGTNAADRNRLQLVAAHDLVSGSSPIGFGEWLDDAPFVGCVLGDSTVAPHEGQPSVASLIDPSGTEVVSLAVSGHTITQQLSAWNSFSGKASLQWIIVQVGLNDIDPGESTTTAIGRLIDLVEAIVSQKPAACRLFVAAMIPCYARMITRYGETLAPESYAKWKAMNRAISGLGCGAVTCVDARILEHSTAMDDGDGYLRSEYDTGDGIHPNLSGRQLIAAQWSQTIEAQLP